VRTIRRDIRDLRHQGLAVRTRGYHLSIGRGQTHKVLIVEQFLKRQSVSEIAHRIKHGLDSIQRYVQTFGRVVYLHRRALSRAEIAFLVGVGEKTVQQYLDLYARYNQPEYQDRLAEIMAPPTSQPFLEMGKKGALP
jgi:predicted DNA-binding transcriptional regulator YafY